MFVGPAVALQTLDPLSPMLILGQVQNKQSASSSSAVSLELSEWTDILWKSEPSSLSDIFCALGFLVLLTLALSLVQSSCFFAVALVFLALLLVTKFFFEGEEVITFAPPPLRFVPC
jgi:hypothetical protein